MMVLDGCFIIEVCRVNGSIVDPKPEDHIFNMLWTFTSFMRDFLHLENQVPFFVLQMLYDNSKGPADRQCSLIELALESFTYGLRHLDVLANYGDWDVKQLLHLIQLSFNKLLPKVPRESNNEYLQLFHSVMKLCRSGIKFKPRKCSSWLDIRFNNGVLEIPSLMIDELTSSFLFNCVVLEQC